MPSCVKRVSLEILAGKYCEWKPSGMWAFFCNTMAMWFRSIVSACAVVVMKAATPLHPTWQSWASLLERPEKNGESLQPLPQLPCLYFYATFYSNLLLRRSKPVRQQSDICLFYLIYNLILLLKTSIRKGLMWSGKYRKCEHEGSL